MDATEPRPRHFELGQKIRRARRRKGFSQERLAGLVGITRRHLIRIENGEHLPSRELRDRLAEETDSAREDLTVSEDDEETHPMSFGHAVQRMFDEAVERAFERRLEQMKEKA